MKRGEQIVMATVVYESGAIRVFGFGLCGALLIRFPTLRSSVKKAATR